MSKVKIYTYSHNRPDFIKLQYETIKRHVKNDYEFIVFNNEQTHGLLCTHFQLIRSPIVEVPNKYVHSGEKFFQIPVEELELIEVPNE